MTNYTIEVKCPHGVPLRMSLSTLLARGKLYDPCWAADEEREDAALREELRKLNGFWARRTARRKASRARPEDIIGL